MVFQFAVATSPVHRESAENQANLTKLLTKNEASDLFKDTKDPKKLEADLAALRGKSDADLKELTEQLAKMEDGGLSDSSKELKKALEIFALSDEKLSEAIKDVESKKEGDVEVKKKAALVAEARHRVQKSLGKANQKVQFEGEGTVLNAYRGLQTLRNSQEGKELQKSLTTFSTLDPQLQNTVMSQLAAPAVKDKAINTAFHDFFGVHDKNKSEATINKAFNDSLSENTKGYSARYRGEFETPIEVFKDRSGNVFSIRGGSEKYGQTVKSIEAAKTPEERKTAFNAISENGLTLHEAQKDGTYREFRYREAGNSQMVFREDSGDRKEGPVHTADPALAKSLGLATVPKTSEVADLRVWSSKSGEPKVAAQSLYLFDAVLDQSGKVEGKDQTQLRIGYTGGKYFVFSTQEGDSANAPERLITEPDARFNWLNTWNTSSGGIYLQNASDPNQYLKMTQTVSPATGATSSDGVRGRSFNSTSLPASTAGPGTFQLTPIQIQQPSQSNYRSYYNYGNYYYMAGCRT